MVYKNQIKNSHFSKQWLIACMLCAFIGCREEVVRKKKSRRSNARVSQSMTSENDGTFLLVVHLEKLVAINSEECIDKKASLHHPSKRLFFVDYWETNGGAF